MPGVAQRVGRAIAPIFHDRGTRRGWVVSSTPRPHFSPGKDTVPILQVAGWAPGPVWTGEKSRPHLDSIPDRRTRSQSLYRLSYPAHMLSNGMANIANDYESLRTESKATVCYCKLKTPKPSIAHSWTSAVGYITYISRQSSTWRAETISTSFSSATTISWFNFRITLLFT